MKKLLLVLLALVLHASFSFAQLQSPEQFLGYKIGTKYTPHHRLVDYYRHVAASVPSIVKLQQYGQTNEGRPLLVAYVSSAGNINNLERIRNANLQLASGGAASTVQKPAIVWLSYNVHGNETSSSEASMLTLFALADPSNTQVKQWLENTVVIIDPCLNPDGRDRYVNWYNSVVGEQYNADPIAREHREPWPGGRGNHYYFDLNRDWAWQTQVESRERVKLYQQWLPQIHVDFHEQGINNPYYFAPAAEPFHEVITPWQRSFQKTIGLNHARYFDEKGWLYFTKETFDLLYPSYGDTYPTYNGSIGMTYEQAGGGVAGLGIRTATGDTLTLADRVQHHYITGLSTIEVASHNADKLLAEFQTFFADAAAGKMSNYQSYVVKREGSYNLLAFINLLDKNKIQYFNSRPASARGYNYHTGKEENFNLGGNDIIVPAAQTAGALVKVLFDPDVQLSDTATYDITAWALPYVFGLKAYATKDKLSYNAYTSPDRMTSSVADPYGYVVRWDGIASAKFVSKLLQQGIKLRFTETPFSSGGQQFDRGSVIVLRTGNQYINNLWNTVRQQAEAVGVQLVPVTTGFVDKGFDFGSSNVRPLNKRSVALFTGEGISSTGTGEVWHFFDKELNYPVTLINISDLARMNWSDFDVIIMPSGNYRFLSDKTSAEQLRSWISDGGSLIAIEDAVEQLARLEWSIKTKKASDTDAKNPYDALRRYEGRERDPITNTTPGSIYRVELDNSHPLAFGYPEYYYALKQDRNLYDFIKGSGWNVGVIKKEKQLSGFVGAKLQRQLQDGLVIGVQEIGRGSVVYFTDDVLFRSFWENGKLLFSNAVFFVGQ